MIKRSIFFLCGLFIACFGVSLIIKSGIGAGPWDAFMVGISNIFGITIGTCLILLQAFYLIFNATLAKKRIQFESIITIFLWGIILDFYMEILLKNVSLSHFATPIKWTFFLIGIIILSVGIGAYLNSKLPTMPYDTTMLVISEKFKMKINVSRTILELIGLVSALIVGGPIGLGTVIILLMIGPLIQVCSQYVNIVFEKI